MRRRTKTVLLLLAVATGLAAAWWMRVPTEPSSAEATPAEEVAPSPDAPPPDVPRRRELPPLPPAAPRDTGLAKVDVPRPTPPSPRPPEPRVARGVLAGEIVDDRGRLVPDAWLVGEGDDCPGFPVRGGRFEVELTPFECDLYAVRMDGALPTRSVEVAVDLRDGDESDLHLVLPSRRTGGLGISFDEVDDGMAVLRVVPGTPADQAGLRPGDVIVEVDGVPANDLDARDFQEAMTGPEGTDVHFVVRYQADDGEEVEQPLVATREFVPDPHWN